MSIPELFMAQMQNSSCSVSVWAWFAAFSLSTCTMAVNNNSLVSGTGNTLTAGEEGGVLRSANSSPTPDPVIILNGTTAKKGK